MFFHFLKIVVVLLRHETVTTMPRQLPCWILCDSLDVSYLNHLGLFNLGFLVVLRLQRGADPEELNSSS